MQSIVKLCKCSSRRSLDDVASQDVLDQVANMGEACLLEVGEDVPDSDNEEEQQQQQPIRRQVRGGRSRRGGTSQGAGTSQSQLTQTESQRSKRHRRRCD